MKGKYKNMLALVMAMLPMLNIIAQEPTGVTVDVFYNHEVGKNGRLQHYTWDDTSRWGGYSEFGKMFQKYGGKLCQLDKSPTPEDLRDSRVYVIVDPDNAKDNTHPEYMDKKTANTIAGWVNDGGRLLVLTNDHENCDLVHINNLTDIFGLHFNDTTILTWSFAGKRHEVPQDYDSIAFRDLPDHPIFKGINKLFMLGTSSITCTGGAMPLLKTKDNDVVMAEARYGRGIVIAVADPWIYNEYIGHTMLPEDFDNGTAADNLARYLMSGLPQFCCGHTMTGNIPTGDTPQHVLGIIGKVNNYWQSNNKPEVGSFWDNAAYHTGNMEAYRLTHNKSYLNYSMRWAEFNHWRGAAEPDTLKWVYRTYGEDQQHVLFGDWQICFQTYIDLYNANVDADVEWVARAKEVMGYECQSKAHDYWWWADALYMVMPVMTKMYILTGDVKYLDKLYENICYTDSLMLDSETGLYYRDARYVYPQHKTEAGKKDFWARGDGWVIAGLAKVLQDMPKEYRYRKFFEEKFRRLAKAVAELQQPDGYWTRSMMDPDQAPGYETSGTAFFTYGILWGINNGFLSEKEYVPIISKAWQYLTCIALQPSGKIGYVQPIGDRAVPGQVINSESQTNFGVGAFLLAACEYYRWLNAEFSLYSVGKGYSGTSVNATIFRKNSIVSKNGWQFVSYYDNDGYVCIGKRKLNDMTFSVNRTQYRGKIHDAHNVISMGIDGKGYLHVAFDHHDSKLHYCRSVAPYSTELGELQQMVGNDEDKVTYPEFYSLKNGDLLFAYRSGKSGQGNLVMNRYDSKKRIWKRVHDVLLDGEGKRNAYWQMQVDCNGIIHLSWVWRDTWLVETNHDLCYACSRDGGKTWEKSTGEKYQLPITEENAEYSFRIPQRSELINQTSIAADNNSNPYIATYWKAENDSAPQYKIVFKHDGKWVSRNVGHRTQDFSLSGGGTKCIPMSRPQLAITNKNGKIIAYYIYRDEESGAKVTLAETTDICSGEWNVMQPYNIVVDAWEPSYDTNLWNSQARLDIFVQRVEQGDGEKTVMSAPQDIMVLSATNGTIKAY